MNCPASLQTILPPAALLPFPAYRACSPVQAWTNPALAQPDALLRHAWFIPLPGDADGVTLPLQKTFLGERYGGQGLGGNGGGVRCGLDGDVQIKGIGRNPLAGASSDFFHSYGGASLNEGIVEALWGEILHRALPHRAVRILGLLRTGTRVPLLAPKPGQGPTTARALILRQPALRPAHYMRSVFHEPGPGMRGQPSDTTRTRAAVAAIGGAFATIFGAAPADPLDPDYLNACLLETFRRAARQIATARAKRIMHGSLMSSNFAIDGRWLDFGTTSSMPDYGQILISPRTAGFMREEEMLRETIEDWPFYLRKYLPGGRGQHIVEPARLWETLQQGLRQALPPQLLKLTGIPAVRLEQLDSALRTALYDCFCRVINSGNRALYTIVSSGPGASSSMPEKAGDYHLNTVLRQAALCRTRGQALAALGPSLADAPLRAEFVHHYWNLRDAYLRRFGRCQPLLAERFLCLNAVRVNTTLPGLYRANLYQAVEALLLSDGDITGFITAWVDKATTVLCDAGDGTVDVTDWFGAPARLTEAEGFTVQGRRLPFAQALARLRPGVMTPSELDQLKHHEH